MSKRAPIQSDLVQIAWALNLYRLATNVVGVFIPLIILRSGGELWVIGLFYLLYALTKLCINYSCMRVIQNRGAHLGLGLGFVFSALQTSSILGYAHYHEIILLVIAAASFALANGFLWNAQHYFISQYMDKKTKSSSIASIEIYGRLSDIVGPVMGGLLGAFFGAAWLLIVSVGLIVTTAVPLRKMRALPSVTDNKARELITYSLRGAPAGDLLANFSFNVETLIGTMVWPIYLAVVLNNYKSIASVATIAAIASIVTTSIAGQRGDRGQDRSVLRQGVATSSIIDIVRLVATASSVVALVSAAYQSSLAYFSNAWKSAYYQHAQDKGPQYIISMEIACDLAYVFFWGLFFILTLTIHAHRLLFNIVFIIAAIAAWGCLLITKQRIRSSSSSYGQ